MSNGDNGDNGDRRQRDYYNTNRESGELLRLSREYALSQQELILYYFRRHGTGERYSPDQIREMVFDNSIPLTSVRRAMTNLTDAGYLEKTLIMRQGSYGKQVHTWTLSDEGG
jgi:hypothetical protein